MKLCRRCAAPVTALNVILDRNGVCNLCHTYEQTGAQLTDTARMAGLFRQRLEMLASARRSQRLLKIFRWSLRLRHHLFRKWLSNPLPPG